MRIGDIPEGWEQDLVMTNKPRATARDARGFKDLIESTECGPLGRLLFALRHPVTARLLLGALHPVASGGRLSAGSVGFTLLLQFQTDPYRTPIENGLTLWNERDAPPMAVADVEFGPQEFDTPERRAEGERLEFSVWNYVDDSTPWGSSIGLAGWSIRPASASGATPTESPPQLGSGKPSTCSPFALTLRKRQAAGGGVPGGRLR
jgi:hypothetical protein